MFFNVLDQQRNETTVCENPINRSLDRIKTMNETSVGIFVVFPSFFHYSVQMFVFRYGF